MIVGGGLALSNLLLALAAGYLLGSIPFGLILTRMAGTTDLRSIGSGNIGATNVLRTGRRDLAAATLLLDALKGTAAVWIAAKILPELPATGGFGAFIGHIAPVWLRFRGGKAVATYLGVLLAVWWPAFIVFALVWLAVAALTRYSSASALVATLAAPLALLWAGLTESALVLSLMTVLVWWKHRPNIARLRAGTESRIGEKAGGPSDGGGARA